MRSINKFRLHKIQDALRTSSRAYSPSSAHFCYLNMSPQTIHQSWLRYIAAIALVVFAAMLRIWPLQALESGLTWLTFYPAVMIAAIYGGLYAGLLAAALSCLTVTLLWSILVAQPFINNSADWLGMSVFVMTCSMISGVAEAMRRAETRAIEAQQQAEAANRAKSVFLSTMSHELRTPMNAILGFSALMRSDPAITEGQLENLNIINRSGEHLLRLINDVLDMAKIEAGRAVLEAETFDLGVLVQDIADMLGKHAEEKGLQLRLTLSAKLPQFIKSDKEKLHRVIVNLVSNAVKFTNHGSVTLRLSDQPGNGVHQLFIEVEDSGIGISKDDQARIFEPFIQLGQSGTQKGTGLGLAIAREYVELMGGNIEVESTPNTGSLFRVTVPVQSAEQIDVIPREVSKERVIGLEPGQPEYRILIVEDQLENQLLLQRLLKDAGFTVKLAENGAEGVELFQSFHPHFIWMDRRMPIMDGLEASRRIRALDGGKEVKIAAVSASVFGEQYSDTLPLGTDDFVRKPYRSSEIFECMKRHLGVRYLYEQSKTSTVDAELSSRTLAQLSELRRQELADALIHGNIKHITELILRIEEQDAVLARVLTHHVALFNYLPILKALEAVDTNNKEAQP